jgi:chromosome segregation ATPase
MELTQEYFDKKLQDLPSKEDLKSFATKHDLSGFVSKEYFDEKWEGLNQRIDGLSTRMDDFSVRMDAMTGRMDGITGRIDGMESKMATKDDLANFVTKDYLDEKFLEFPTKQEFRSLQATVEDIQEKVTRIDIRTDEDTRAIMKDIVKLRRRSWFGM